jgi:5-hydroxyisourate hydrolase-like protein (transthyretin family)
VTRGARLAFLCAALAAGTSLLAQSPSASYSVSGTVVSATTGTPLDRAEVTLSTTGPDESQVADIFAAQDGSFRFDHLPQGTYSLQGSRRGYIMAGYQEHDGFFTGIVTGPGLDTSNLRLALWPTAVIFGTITDSSGEPVSGAQVHLFRKDQRSGEERIVNTQTEFTDDLGTYEFSRVRAGTFYLSVSAAPWYAIHPGPKTDDTGTPLPPDQQPPSPLDVAYSTTFYESATDSDSATPLTVKAGDHVEADFSLHAVPSVHIQIRMPSTDENRGIQMPQLMQDVFGNDEYQNASPFMTTTNSGTTVIDFSGIAPGHYFLRQWGPQGGGSHTAMLDLTSNQSVDFSSLATAGGADLTGRIAMASGEKLPARTVVTLIPTESGRGGQGQPLAEDGSFTLHALTPGEYDVQVGSRDAPISIVQMMATGAAVQGNRITIANQPVLLAATLARGATTVNGFARQSGRPASGVMIFLVPRNPALRDLYRRDQSNTDGSFTLNRVVPGDYTLVAIENGWTLEWARPEVMAPYLARGTRVQVTGARTLDLPAPIEAQPR